MDLALKADGFLVETTSEAISNEGDTTGEASRVRVALEGSRAFRTGGGVLTPGLELAGCAMTAATPRPARASSSAGGCRTPIRKRA